MFISALDAISSGTAVQTATYLPSFTESSASFAFFQTAEDACKIEPPSPLPSQMQLGGFFNNEEDVLGSSIIDELLDMHSDFKLETTQGASEVIEVCEDPLDPWRGVWDNSIQTATLDFNFESIQSGDPIML